MSGYHDRFKKQEIRKFYSQVQEKKFIQFILKNVIHKMLREFLLNSYLYNKYTPVCKH